VPHALRRFTRQPTRKPNPFAEAHVTRSTFTESEIQDRLVLLFVNEAIRCLDEGVLQTPTDGDLGAVLGLGFPPFTGGPFHYADSVGSAALEAKLRALAERYGRRYEPGASLLERRRFFEE
jgi:3-hydroxyacyl-CoA dehydrogenase/enoyl-CoA hydratase/3-hydroxybutyryl-CoA epimerase